MGDNCEEIRNHNQICMLTLIKVITALLSHCDSIFLGSVNPSTDNKNKTNFFLMDTEKKNIFLNTNS